MAQFSLDGLRPETDADRTWIAPNATLIGRVRLHPDASVWFGAVLRGDIEPIEIGPRSNVQDNAVLHTDHGFPLTVGADVTVGHRAMLHGCTIGDGTLVGMGATVLNGAVIGRNCVIGACALVGEGRAIPDNSLVLGIPGRVVGPVSPEQEMAGRRGAARYVENAARYRSGLEELRAPPSTSLSSGPDPSDTP